MILIADSGSTKTNWSICASGISIENCITNGINPFFIDQQGIVNLLNNDFILSEKNIHSIRFYGSGCIPEKSHVVIEALKTYFETDNISVYSDLLGASHSLCQKDKGIVCILGTGSNSGYYDGNKIIHNVSPLGYILGDEGSGAEMGKKLVADILKKQLPDFIIKNFLHKYKLTTVDIIDKVYRQPFPNRFLAGFTPFLSEHIQEPDIKKLVESCLDGFIERNVKQYTGVKNLPIHFTGSIAYYFRENLKNVMQKHQLNMGKIRQDPMPGLIQYYKNYDQ